VQLPRLLVTHEVDPSKLVGIKDRLADLRPAWIEDVQPIITDFLTKRFETEGAYMTGAKWAPLAPASKELRARPGHGRGGIGRDTNAMWASFVKSAGSTAAPNGILLIDEERYERGSSLKWAQWFHRGYNSTRKPVLVRDKDGNKKWIFVKRAAAKRIPARPIIPDPLPAELVEQVESALMRYVSGGKT